MPPWLTYTLLRLGLFTVALALLLLLGVPPWAAAIAAALIGFCVAYIFFRPQRDRLISSVRRSPEGDDESAEDGSVDGSTAEDGPSTRSEP